ncbi:MAG: AraC family transcriptional regulator [Chitinophagaceae bacterium]|nr:AraC family transcriptional regulator [Chitinophagaceae bacterium]
MKVTQIESFDIIGISTRTTNENQQSATDIPQLWNKFLSENIIEQIPGKIDNTIYCIYTDYEKDHTKPYTTIFGCKVKNLEKIPEGFVGKTINKSNYKVFTIKGKLSDDIIFKKWVEIWNADIKRTFTADFEVYGEKAQNPDNAEVDIFIAIE